jgi:hypothetical protein
MSQSRKNQLELTSFERQVLLGSLLGDGSLKPPYKGYANSFFQMRHSSKGLV